MYFFPIIIEIIIKYRSSNQIGFFSLSLFSYFSDVSKKSINTGGRDSYAELNQDGLTRYHVEPRHDRSCWAETTSGPANEDVLSCIPDNVSPPGDAGRLEFLVYASSSFRLAPSLLLGTINAEATGQTRSFPLLSSSHYRLSLLFLYPAPYREKYVARWVCCRSIELCSMETTVPKSDDGNLERIFRKTI